MRHFISDYLKSRGFLAHEDDVRYLEQVINKSLQNTAGKAEVEDQLDQFFRKGLK